MEARYLVVLGFLCCATGATIKEDFQNQTIECVFREYDRCYRNVASLGANFSVKYDDTPQEMNLTCKSEVTTKNCLYAIPSTCNTPLIESVSKGIHSLIHNLCTNKTVEHDNFLNSSNCYNKYQMRRQRCITANSYNFKTDAKSLCCSNKKTLECLQNDLRNVCSKNSTDFQNHLMHVYRSHHSVVCGPYYKYCGTGTTILASALGVLFATFLSLLAHRM